METLEIIQNKERELQPLYNRMDVDERSLTEKYQMMQLDKPDVAMDNVVNVTMNYPGTYCNDLASMISQASIQCVVEGFKKNKPMLSQESDIIERYLEICRHDIDEKLIRAGLPPLIVWLANHIVVRGWIGSRYLTYIEEGKYCRDFKAWDMRYGAWEFGAKGLNWASFKTWRYPQDIVAEYPKAPISGSELVPVYSYYDDTKEEVIVGDIQVKLWNHNRGYVPCVIQPSTAGFLFRGKDYIEHEGESALFLDRDLFDELNRSVSIEQTLAQKAAMPAYSQEKQDPNSSSDPYPDKPGAQTAYNTGEKPELLPVGDFGQAAQLGRRDIFEGLQQGGRNIDIGNIDQSFSNVALARIEDIRKKALIPRFSAIDSFLSKLSRLMIQEREFVKVGQEEYGNTKFTSKDFEGDYTIKYLFMPQSKEIDLMNLASANAALAAGLPREVVIKDILRAENPSDIIAKMDSAKAEQADPVIMLVRLAHSLVDEAEDLSEEQADAKLIESMMLTERAVEIILQRKNPPVTTEGNQLRQEPQVPEARGNTNMLLPMLGNTGELNKK